MPASLVFCFDYLSPYAWLAWNRVHALAAAHDREVEPRPVLLAALLDANGQKGPAEIPSKRLYVFRDCLRHAARLGVPFAPPPAHPFNPLLALRVTALEMPASARRALVDRLFRETWAGGRGVTDPDVVGGVAEEVGVTDAVARAQAPEAKARVRVLTEATVAAGAFGVPTVLADGELFWGLDSFGHLDRFLAGADTVDEALFARWRDLPAAATRRA